MQTIQIEAFGNPAEVLKVVDIPDVGAPAEHEVVIALEASPINMKRSLDDFRPLRLSAELAKRDGTEGVGRVIGRRQRCEASETGRPHPDTLSRARMAERIKTDAGRLRPLPSGDVNQFAMLASIRPNRISDADRLLSPLHRDPGSFRTVPTPASGGHLFRSRNRSG